LNNFENNVRMTPEKIVSNATIKLQSKLRNEPNMQTGGAYRVIHRKSKKLSQRKKNKRLTRILKRK
jgi:hypothetical protein